jgi:predicted nuclease of predicted toxin-antitoxin system
VRFLLDANLSPAMIALFRNRGHDAIHVDDVSEAGTGDDVIAAIAHKHGRCLITGDFDFANLLEFEPRHYSGIVVLTAPRGTGAPHLERLVLHFLDRVPELAPLAGKLMIVELGRIRVRE